MSTDITNKEAAFTYQGLINTPLIDLYTLRAGSGPKLLFLAGSNTDFRLSREVFSSPLCQYFDVVSYEPRGLGRTQLNKGPSDTSQDWSMQDYAADAVALMDALGWKDAYVVGESFGGMTAAELAVSYPERVKALCIMVAAPGGEGGSSYPLHDLLELPKRERVIKSLSIQDSAFAEYLKENPLPELSSSSQAEADTSPLSPPNPITAAIAESMTYQKAFLSYPENQVGYPKLLAARAKHDVYEHLNSLDIPSIIISGTRDQLAPMQRGQAMAEQIPNAEFHALEGGHGVGFASDDASNLLISRWLG